jgi:hypothetical protein
VGHSSYGDIHMSLIPKHTSADEVPILCSQSPEMYASPPSNEDALQDAATEALGKWMTADAAPELLRLAQTLKNDKYRLRALRGYIRVARQLKLKNDERIAMCRSALPLVTRLEDRHLVRVPTAGSTFVRSAPSPRESPSDSRPIWAMGTGARSSTKRAATACSRRPPRRPRFAPMPGTITAFAARAVAFNCGSMALPRSITRKPTQVSRCVASLRCRSRPIVPPKPGIGTSASGNCNRWRIGTPRQRGKGCAVPLAGSSRSSRLPLLFRRRDDAHVRSVPPHGHVSTSNACARRPRFRAGRPAARDSRCAVRAP